MPTDNSNRISLRLPHDLMLTLRRRIDGRRSRWSSVGEYLKERLIYDLERSHERTDLMLERKRRTMVTAARLSPEPRLITVGMPYPGDVISVNHYLGARRDGGHYVKQEAQAWMDMLGWVIKQWHIEEWKLPLSVTCDGRFKDENHAPDLSNLCVCTLNAIQEVTGTNDKHFRWHDGTRTFNKDMAPELKITIEEAE